MIEGNVWWVGNTYVGITVKKGQKVGNLSKRNLQVIEMVTFCADMTNTSKNY